MLSITNEEGYPYYRDKDGEYRADGYFNEHTGWGGSGDNINATHYYQSPTLDQYELEAQYESNWIVARGVEAPVKDRLAKGVTFLTNDDESERRQKAVEGVQNDLKTTAAFDHLILANFWDRLSGGAIIYFDFGDDIDGSELGLQKLELTAQKAKSLNLPLESSMPSMNFELRDSQRGLPQKIWVVDRWSAWPVSYYMDGPKAGEPEIYAITLLTTGWSRVVYAHESRCIVFRGLPLTLRQRSQRQMWGNSLVQRVNDAVKHYDISLKAIADIFQDFNYKSLQIEDLGELIAAGSWDVIGKMTALAIKNAHGQSVGVHGPNTELKKQSTTVAGLTDMAGVMVNIVCGAFNIPYSRFFSAEGGALAGTAAETDVKNYHAGLVFDQEHTDRPHIERFLWFLGYEPEKFPFVFPALADLTEKEQLETDKLQTEIDDMKIISNVMTSEEVAISRHSTPEPINRQYNIDFNLRREMTVDEPEEPPEEETEDRADMGEDRPSFKVVVRDKKEGAA